jgi:hypothetical protein
VVCHFPAPIAIASLTRDFERLVNANEIVEHCMVRDRASVILEKQAAGRRPALDQSLWID